MNLYVAMCVGRGAFIYVFVYSFIYVDNTKGAQGWVGYKAVGVRGKGGGVALTVQTLRREIVYRKLCSLGEFKCELYRN